MDGKYGESVLLYVLHNVFVYLHTIHAAFNAAYRRKLTSRKLTLPCCKETPGSVGNLHLMLETVLAIEHLHVGVKIIRHLSTV